MKVGQYDLISEIGKGSFASVYKAERNGKIYAIKSVLKAKLNRKLAENLETEIDILKGIEHPHIVHLFEVVVSTCD
jgi:serine/threonine-protein kinase ULK2